MVVVAPTGRVVVVALSSLPERWPLEAALGADVDAGPLDGIPPPADASETEPVAPDGPPSPPRRVRCPLNGVAPEASPGAVVVPDGSTPGTALFGSATAPAAAGDAALSPLNCLGPGFSNTPLWATATPEDPMTASAAVEAMRFFVETVIRPS